MNLWFRNPEVIRTLLVKLFGGRKRKGKQRTRVVTFSYFWLVGAHRTSVALGDSSRVLAISAATVMLSWVSTSGTEVRT